MALIK